MTIIRPSLAVLFFATSTASAQSFNIVVGPPGVHPSASYSAAGLAGNWTEISTTHNTYTYNINDVNGTTTGVRVWQYGGTVLLQQDDPGTSGDDAALMDQCLVTYSPTLETCLFFQFIQNGTYEVLIYAWMPGQPTVRSWARSDEEPGTPRKIVGGAWPGHHQQFVTFSRHICNVTNNLLRVHSGIVAGDDPMRGAACNGVQIRLLPPPIRGDLNCDGVVSTADVPAFVSALLDPASYAAAYPACNIAMADMNFDGTNDGRDVQLLVNAVVHP